MDAEETIRQQGKSWNYKNLTTMAQTLEEAFKAECTDFLLHKNNNNYFLLTPAPKAGGRMFNYFTLLITQGYSCHNLLQLND